MLNPEDIESSKLYGATLEAHFKFYEWRQFGAPIGAETVLNQARDKAVYVLGSFEEADELVDMAQRDYWYTVDELNRLQ